MNEHRQFSNNNTLEFNNSDSANEALYLMNYLEVLLNSEEIDQALQEIEKTEKYIKTQSFPYEILSAYTKGREIFEDLKVLLNTLSKGTDVNLVRELGKGLKVGYEASNIVESLQQNGESERFSNGVGILYILFKTVKNHYDLQDEKERWKENLLREYKEKYQKNKSNIDCYSKSLAKKCGWRYSEVEFISEENQQKIREALEKNDISKIVPIYLEYLEKAPKNPFRILLSFFMQLRSFTNNEEFTKKFIDQNLNKIKYATQLIPQNSFYNDMRLKLLQISCVFSQILGKENEALEIAEEGLKIATHDFSYFFRMAKATILTKQGRLEDAGKLFIELLEEKPHNPDLLYNIACFFSIKEDSDAALSYLKRAILYGYFDIQHLKNDEDLHYLRKQKKYEFDDLTKVSFSCGINYGILNDDIWLKNESQFTITNVKLTVKNETSSSDVKELTVNEIISQKTYKWENAVSVPKNIKLRVELECDQNR